MKTNIQIAALAGLMVNAVLFGVGAVAVLSIPALAEHAAYLLPAVIVASFVATPFIARAIVPRMRLRNRRRRRFART